MGKQRSRQPSKASAPSPAAKPKFEPDPPGAGINRRRPWLLRTMIAAWVLWLLYLAWQVTLVA